MRQRWGDVLEHVARIIEYYLPQIYLFGWLAQVQPFHGPKRKWRDLVKSDLQSLGISDGYWCTLAKDWRQWQELCLQCTDDQQGSTQVKTVVCAPCG